MCTPDTRLFGASSCAHVCTLHVCEYTTYASSCTIPAVILETQCQCKTSLFVDMCVQMSHLETSKEDKLSGTLALWYLNAKSRGTQYIEQLSCL